jgi:hypothetical protein
MRLIHIYTEVHMACGHEALSKLCKKKMKSGDVAAFINTAWTAVKLLVSNEFLIHYKHPRGQIAPETIKELPNFIEGKKLNYNKALEKVINEHLKKRNK